ncbi:MAG: hypothetical protein K0R00_201 [Herbinix sp.]|nr:hypothetical protein [Herbinix sp.]
MNLDIINEINQAVAEETKEVKSEELQGKEKILEKNAQTVHKIEQEKITLSSNPTDKGKYGLNQSKPKEESIFKKSSGGSLDDFFKDKETDKKSSSGYSSYGYSGYNQPKKEETKQEKAREFAGAFSKRAMEHAHKEWQHEEEVQKNSWNIFELQEKVEEERRKTRSLTKEAIKKLQNKDMLKKSFLKGLASAGKGIIEYLYNK